ncbi:MAG: hypothetical protein GY794_12770 [bacterium]|nr:hypothetical protein [bacterium]
MKNLDEAVQITLDPVRRHEQIECLKKRLRFSRVAILICGVVTLASIIAFAMDHRASYAPGIFLGVSAILLAKHVGVSLRLVQLKVEEERDKKADE